MRNRCLLRPPVSIGRTVAFLAAVVLTTALLSTAYAQSKLPIQRFGVSDFRLTSPGGISPTFRFSPDGKRIAGTNSQQAKVWSFPDGKLLHDFSNAIQSDCIGFASDGKELLALYLRQTTVDRFDVDTGRLLRRTKLADFEEEETETYHDISSDGKWLIARNGDGHLSVWDTQTGNLQLRKHLKYGANRCAISNAGVLTVWTAAFLDRYDLISGEQLSQVKMQGKPGFLVGTPQGTLFAGYSASEKAIIFWDTTGDTQVGGKIPIADELQRELRDAALSADGRRFVFWTLRDKWLWNKQSAIYDVETGKLICSFDPPGGYFVEQPEISPDGRYVFFVGGRTVFTPVDTTTGKLVREIPDHVMGVQKLTFTPDGHTLLVGSRDKREAWNVDTGEPGTLLEKWYHSPNVAAVGNKSALVSGIKGGGFRLQNIESGATEREYETGTNKYFSEVQLSVDRKSFVGMESLQGGLIRRWSIADGKVISERQPPARRSEGRIDESKMIRGLTLGGSRVVRLEQVVKPSKRPDGSIDWGRADLILEDWATQIVTNRLPVSAMGRFAFAGNADGTLFAAAVSDQRSPPGYGEKWGSTHLLVWDVATGWERLRIDREMHSYFGAFAMVAITRDGRLVATVSEHDRIEIWNGFNGYQLDGFDAGGGVSALALSDDGTMLATGHEDGSVRLWNTRAAWDQSVPRRSMNQTFAQQCWKDLAGDGRKPALAWQTLLGNPGQATEMLKTNLKQALWTKGVVGELENVVVPQPEKDQEPLDAIPPIPPVMRAAQQSLEKATTDEPRNRYKQLLDTASRPMSPESRRPILGILLAEQLDTPDSRQLLEEIAAGSAGAFETQLAKASLVRIRLREAPPDKTPPE